MDRDPLLPHLRDRAQPPAHGPASRGCAIAKWRPIRLSIFNALGGLWAGPPTLPKASIFEGRHLLYRLVPPLKWKRAKHTSEISSKRSFPSRCFNLIPPVDREGTAGPHSCPGAEIFSRIGRYATLRHCAAPKASIS